MLTTPNKKNTEVRKLYTKGVKKQIQKSRGYKTLKPFHEDPYQSIKSIMDRDPPSMYILTNNKRLQRNVDLST